MLIWVRRYNSPLHTAFGIFGFLWSLHALPIIFYSDVLNFYSKLLNFHLFFEKISIQTWSAFRHHHYITLWLIVMFLVYIDRGDPIPCTTVVKKAHFMLVDVKITGGGNSPLWTLCYKKWLRWTRVDIIAFGSCLPRFLLSFFTFYCYFGQMF